MNPTKTGLYSTSVGDRFILLYWDGEDWVDQDGIRPCYKEVHWKGKPLFVPALRTWIGLTDEEIKEIIGPWGDTPVKGYTRKLFDQIQAKLREKNT